MECGLALQILPMDGNNTEDICAVVDDVIAYIDSTGISYFVGPFETTIEGDFDACMHILQECQKRAIQAGCEDLMTYVKIHYAPTKSVLTTAEKLANYHAE